MEILKVENVIKTYANGDKLLYALNDVSFSVNQGEFIAIVGPSGSGKSTLLHIIGGIDKPTDGKVFINGTDVSKLKTDKMTIFRRTNIGLVYQFYNLLPTLNVDDNIVLPLMLDGKKGTARGILYDAFALVEKKTGENAVDVFGKALANITPVVELKVRRVGGQNYQVPVEVSTERKITLGLRWLVNYSRNRNEKTMVERLANEIIDAANGVGASVKKRDDTHKMAEANKAFAHYRW